MEVDFVGAAVAVSVAAWVTSEEFGPGAVAAGAVESEAVDSDEGVELLKAVSLFCQRIRGAGEIQRGANDVEGIRRSGFGSGRAGGWLTSVMTGFGVT